MKLSATLALMTALTLSTAGCSLWEGGQSASLSHIPKARNLTPEDQAKLQRLKEAMQTGGSEVTVSKSDLAFLVVLAHQERTKLRLRDSLNKR